MGVKRFKKIQPWLKKTEQTQYAAAVASYSWKFYSDNQDHNVSDEEWQSINRFQMRQFCIFDLELII